jgi:hypothetical protein
MDMTTLIIAAALLLTAATLSIILFEAIRILWTVTPNWLRLTIGSLLALVIVIIVTL